MNMRVPKLSEVNNREKNRYIESRFLTSLILKIKKIKNGCFPVLLSLNHALNVVAG